MTGGKNQTEDRKMYIDACKDQREGTVDNIPRHPPPPSYIPIHSPDAAFFWNYEVHSLTGLHTMIL